MVVIVMVTVKLHLRLVSLFFIIYYTLTHIRNLLMYHGYAGKVLYAYILTIAKERPEAKRNKPEKYLEV